MLTSEQRLESGKMLDLMNIYETESQAKGNRKGCQAGTCGVLRHSKEQAQLSRGGGGRGADEGQEAGRGGRTAGSRGTLLTTARTCTFILGEPGTVARF